MDLTNLKHQNGEGDEIPASVAADLSKSRTSRRKRAVQPKLRSTTQRLGKSTNPFASSTFVNAHFLRRISGLVAGVSLVDKCYFDMVAVAFRPLVRSCSLAGVTFSASR